MKKTSRLILILILGVITMNMNAEGMKNKEKRVIVICAHPDHRNTSLLVQDAAFLVNVPKILPEVPALIESPLFLYTRGRYADRQKPHPDIVVDITPVEREKAYIIDAHASQIYEWLPWINRSNKIIPDTQEEKIEYILKEYVLKRGEIKEKDKPVVEKWYGSRAKEVKTIEAFEICEFGRAVNDQDIRELFPMFPK